MPKYFEGDRELPEDVVIIEYNNGMLNGIEQVLGKTTGRFCINVKLPGIPENSLGYLFIVDKKNDRYTVLDSLYLTRIIKHASGIEFDFDIQNEFHRIRNEIGLD